MSSEPTNTVAFLFTDVERSTKIWSHDDAPMQVAIKRHFDIMDDAVTKNGGVVFKTVGDAVCAAFPTVKDALAASISSQQSLQAEIWPTQSPINVRMAIHCGMAQERNGDYFGFALSRVSRLLSTAHGKQVVLSSTAQELVADYLPADVRLKDLGSHRLKDLYRPEHVYQVCAPGLDTEFPALRSLDAYRHNLPQQLTPLVGRDKELVEVAGRIRHARLVTLTGMGGTGKTRLGLQVAAEMVDEFADGVWLCELSLVGAENGIDGVAQQIAVATGMAEGPGHSITQSLIDHLRSKQILLLIDNCEHVIDACAELVGLMTKSCVNLRILATSRESLRTYGEEIFWVPPLASPAIAPHDGLEALDRETAGITSPWRQKVAEYDLDRLKSIESVQLFVERATAASPTFVLSRGNAGAVASVCQQLEGIPLALELAAVRIKVLSVDQLAQRLPDMFRLLTGGSRTSSARHQTLRAMIDWSYELLTEKQRLLMSRLSVFTGSWTLEAAEEICGFGEIEDWEVLDNLAGLVDKSLVQKIESKDSTRYRMLETLRQYGQERLDGGPERDDVRQRHFQYFGNIAQQAEPLLVGPNQVEWLQRLDDDHGNLRAALNWGLGNGPAVPHGLLPTDFAASLFRFWVHRGFLSEGRTMILGALEAGFDAPVYSRARAHYALSVILWRRCDYSAAVRHANESMKLAESIDNDNLIAGALNTLGRVACETGDYENARTLLTRSIEINRRIGDRRMVGVASMNLGTIELDLGNFQAARELHEGAVTVFREIGDYQAWSTSLQNLGAALMEEGDCSRAETCFTQSLGICREIGDQDGVAYAMAHLSAVSARGLTSECDGSQAKIGPVRRQLDESLTASSRLEDKALIAYNLELCVQASASTGDLGTAVTLLAAVDAIRTSVGTTRSSVNGARLGALAEVLASQLSPSDIASLQRAGGAMPLDQAIDFACAWCRRDASA